jgi:hypothetical protein
MAQDEVALDIEFALRIWRNNWNTVVSAKSAHKVLHSMRRDLTVPGDNPAASLGFSEETVDLTETQDFNWRGYVCNRKSEEQLRELVGEGITRFELRFLTLAWDTNLKQARCDFVAHRVDNTCVRFHPSATGDTVPVIGRLADWCAQVHPTALMDRVIVHPPDAPQGEIARASEHNSYFRNISQSDVIGKKTAQEFLDTASRVWQEGHRDQKFTTELTSQASFPWTLYLSSTPWGRQMYEDGVSEVHLVWLGDPHNTAAFYVLMTDRQAFVIHPGRHPPVSSDAVQCIQWWT